ELHLLPQPAISGQHTALARIKSGLAAMRDVVSLKRRFGSSATDRYASGGRAMSASPQKRTLIERVGMSALCHVWTAPSWQGFSSRLQAGRCSHVFGLLARRTRPLAIMPSADQVPVKSPHSIMHWHVWVVLIAGSTGTALRAVRPPNLHVT